MEQGREGTLGLGDSTQGTTGLLSAQLPGVRAKLAIPSLWTEACQGLA